MKDVCGCSIALRILLIVTVIAGAVIIPSGSFAVFMWLSAVLVSAIIWLRFPKRMFWVCGKREKPEEQEPIPVARLVRGKEGKDA